MVLKHEMNPHAVKITNRIILASNWWDNVLNTIMGGLRLGTEDLGLIFRLICKIELTTKSHSFEERKKILSKFFISIIKGKHFSSIKWGKVFLMFNWQGFSQVG